LTDDSVFCNKCGNKIIKEESKQSSENNVKIAVINENDLINSELIITNRKKVAIVLMLVVIIIVILFPIGNNLVISYQKYNHAKTMLNNNNFNDAIEEFMELKNFLNSPEMVLESKYKFALVLMEDKKYLAAIDTFDELGNYSNTESIKREATYLQSKEYMNSKNYTEAEKMLQEIQGYEDSNDLLVEDKYQIGKVHLDRKEYSNALSIFNTMQDYKDVPELIVEANYGKAIDYYEDGNFNLAQQFFQDNMDFRDSNKYLDNISTVKKYEGTWENKSGYEQKMFYQWNEVDVFFPKSYNTSVFKHVVSVKGVNLTEIYGTTYEIKNDILIVNDSGKVEEYKKISDYYTIPEEKPSPKIGMTAQEVRNTNWGSPKDINKTTTANHTSEQWVYSLSRYIYLEDGIVTAIQE
jgi:tetratricopeptide (TPR) repeat protein